MSRDSPRGPGTEPRSPEPAEQSAEELDKTRLWHARATIATAAFTALYLWVPLRPAISFAALLIALLAYPLIGTGLDPERPGLPALIHRGARAALVTLLFHDVVDTPLSSDSLPLPVWCAAAVTVVLLLDAATAVTGVPNVPGDADPGA